MPKKLCFDKVFPSLQTAVNLDFDAKVPIPFSIFPSSYKNDVPQETTVTRVEAEVDRTRVGREDLHSSFEAVNIEKGDRPRRREEVRIYEEHDRPARRTEVNIDIERNNRSDLDITEREYRRRVQPTYDIEYERKGPSAAHVEESRQRIYDIEREPPARETARIHVEEKTYDRESKMGYYDDSGNYHSFRRGLERAADRILHPIHGGGGSREDITIKESSSRENVRYVQRPGGHSAGTVTIPSHHIRIGDLVMLQGRPCQVIRITTSSQTGQHRYLGVDLFTKQLQEESSFMSNPAPSVYVQNMLGPVFKQYRVLDIHDEGIVAMTESGDVIQSLQVMDSGALFSKLSDAFSDGKGSVRVLVINDGGRELAVDFKVIHGSRL